MKKLLKRITGTILALMLIVTCIPNNLVCAEGTPTRTTRNMLYIETKGFVENCYFRDAVMNISKVEIHDSASRDLKRTIPINRTLEFSDGTLSDTSCYVAEDSSIQLNWEALISNDNDKDYFISLLLNPDELEEGKIDDVFFNGLHMDQIECRVYDDPNYYIVIFKVPSSTYFVFPDSGDDPTRALFYGEGIYKDGTYNENTFIGWGSSKDDVNSIYTEFPKDGSFNAYPLWGTFELLESPSKENNYTIKTNVYKYWSEHADLIYKWYVYKDCDITLLDGLPSHNDIVPGYIFHQRNDYNLKYASGNLSASTNEAPSPEIQAIITVGGDFNGQLYIEDTRGNRLAGKTIGIKASSTPLSLKNFTGTKTEFTYNPERDMYEFVVSDENINSNCFEFTFAFSEETNIITYVIDDNPGFYELNYECDESLVTRQPGRYKATVKFWNDTENVDEFVIEEPVQPSSRSTKTYKASNTDKTAEKISGSGKKGSTRTITPLEGKKVGKVTVTDKNGNKVEVANNQDGTYSFTQPASDVTVEVTYVNRELTLTIGSTEVSVDGERSNLDVCPVIRNDRTMLPIRWVAENIGAKVQWDEKNPNYVLITKGDIKIEITIGSDIMLVNGKETKLDSVAFAENDRTYLPVRAISEATGALVEWNEARPMEVKIYER